MASVLAIRHCASSGQAPDAPLSEAGRAQAERLARQLDAPDLRPSRIVSSPYLRARETIAPAAQRLGLAFEIDARLAERTLSPQPVADWRERVARSFRDLDDRVPGGESGRETLGRGWAALEDALAAPGGRIALASHGQLLSLVLQRIDPRFGFADWRAMTNPDLFLIERAPGGALGFLRIPPRAL